MSYSVFENTMAKLLTNKRYLEEFKKNPQTALIALDLTQDEKKALIDINQDQLTIAAISFRKKRTQHLSHSHGSIIRLFFRNLFPKK